MSGIAATETTYLTTAQAAAMLQVTRQTMRTWRIAGTGPRYIRLPGRGVRFRLEELRSFLRGRSFASASEEAAARTAGT